MLIENQLIRMQWSNRVKQYYIDKGYVYTNNGDVFYINVRDLPSGSNKLVACKCDYCGKEILVTYMDYLKHTHNESQKLACLSCKGKKFSEYRSAEQKEFYFNKFVGLCEEHGYTPISKSCDYVNEKTRLKFICPKHGLQETTYERLNYGKGCIECGREANIKGELLSPDKVSEIVNGKNNNSLLNPEEYVGSKINNLRVRCGQCGEIFTTSLGSIQAGDGMCPSCAVKSRTEKRKLSQRELCDRIERLNENILLNPEDYVNSKTYNLMVKCGSCGKVFRTSLNNYQKSQTGKCPDCNGNSQGETFLAMILDKYHIQYYRQQSFEGCVDKLPLLFDFYLPNFNLCVEFDGQHHYNPVWGEEYLKSTLLHDAMKDNYCRWNRIRMLRIPYWERDNIEQILLDNLNLEQKDEYA